MELYLHSPNTPSWRGDQLGGAQGQLFTFLTYIVDHQSHKTARKFCSQNCLTLKMLHSIEA